MKNKTKPNYCAGANRYKAMVLLVVIPILTACGIFASRYFFDRSLHVTIDKVRTFKNLTCGIYGYSAGPDVSPPDYIFLLCHVNVAYNGRNTGLVNFSSNSFRLVTSNSERYQSLKFLEREVPTEITSLPSAPLRSGGSVSGDLVFEVFAGATPVVIEYSPPDEPDKIRRSDSVLTGA